MKAGGRSSRHFHRFDVVLTVLTVLCGVALAGELSWPTSLAWMNRPRTGIQVARRCEAPESEEGPPVAVVYLLYLPERLQHGWGWNYDLAVAAPERFAAIAPLAGGGDVSQAVRLMELPIWALHGAVDEVVPLSQNVKMVDAVRAAGGNAKLTVYENQGHEIDQRTYARADFWDWLLAQRRGGRGSDVARK